VRLLGALAALVMALVPAVQRPIAGSPILPIVATRACCSAPYSSSERYSCTSFVKSRVSTNVCIELYVTAVLRHGRMDSANVLRP
jgi:hypothetical protein